jgi:hypothetical protein
MEREKQIEKYLRLRVEERGGVCMKFVSPGQDGVPDRIVVMPGGRVYFVELKTETGKLSRIQKYQLKRLTDLDQICSVVYGKEGVNEFLKDLDDWVVGSLVYDSDGSSWDLQEELDGI